MSLRMWRDESFYMLLTGEKPLGEILTYLVSWKCAYISKWTNFTSQISLEKTLTPVCKETCAWVFIEQCL